MQQTDNHTQDNNLFPTDTWQFAIDPSTLMVQDSAEATFSSLGNGESTYHNDGQSM